MITRGDTRERDALLTTKSRGQTAIATAALAAWLLACGGADERSGRGERTASTQAVRLVDRFEASGLSHKREPILPKPVRLEIGDAERPADVGAMAGPGVSRLRVRDGLLTGRASDDVPILLFRRRIQPERHAQDDTLVRVEIQLRATAGSQLRMAFDDSQSVNFDEQRAAAENLAWPMTTELKPDGELHRYTLTSPFEAIPAIATQNILIRPSDEKGAHFGIESMRLVFASDELAGVESGVGWHGLGEIYREALAQRAGERIRVSLAVPTRPVFLLSVGTPNETPVRFRASVSRAGTADAQAREADDAGEIVLDRTATQPNRWESLRVPLDRFAGETVTLRLEVDSERADAIGYWGAAAIRQQVETPPRRAAEAATEPPQGVILVVADALRKDHLDVYGHSRPTAPQLGVLAAEGARFEDVVAQGTWTKVALPSLLTGLYPSTHGVLDFPDRLPASGETLAESFRQAGYATLSLSSSIYSGRFSNLQQGFETVHEVASLSEQRSDPHSSKTAREYVDRALAWLEPRRDLPFFVLLHVSDPHDPYPPRPPYDTLWAEPGRAARLEKAREDITPRISDPLRRLFFRPNRREVEAAGCDAAAFATGQRAGYDGSIRGMDVEIGRLIERLRELDLDRKTLVVFTSDHGEEFLEHDASFHGQSVYGELTGVPLILWQPGTIPPETVVEQTVQSIDIAPTILSMSGLPIPDAVQGQTLEPLLTGRGRWTPRPAVAMKATTTHESSPTPRDTAAFALIDEGWKLVHQVRPQGGPPFELFNHGEDPLDAHDLAAEFPETVERLAARLNEWHAEIESAR